MNTNRRDFIRMGAIAGATAAFAAKGERRVEGNEPCQLPLPDGPEFAGMSGAYAALITPYKPDGSVNEEMIEKVIEYGLANGLTGFYLTGSTGEGFLLSLDERKLVYDRAVKAARGRAKLIAHAGCQYMSRSTDGGISWSKPEPSALVAPLSPATIKRLPTGDLLAVWNDHAKRPDEAAKGPAWAHGRRTPLTTAISRDDGRTWTNAKNLEDDPDGWFCYIALQPLNDGTALLGYCAYKGLAHSRIVKVPVEWFYK